MCQLRILCAYCELNNSISSAILFSYFFLRSNDLILPKRCASLYIIIKPSYTAIALSTWLTHRCIWYLPLVVRKAYAISTKLILRIEKFSYPVLSFVCQDSQLYMLPLSCYFCLFEFTSLPLPAAGFSSKNKLAIKFVSGPITSLFLLAYIITPNIT